MTEQDETIKVVKSTLCTDLKRLGIRTEAGHFFSVAFTEYGKIRYEEANGIYFCSVPKAMRALLIRQCRSGAVDFQALEEALARCS